MLFGLFGDTGVRTKLLDTETVQDHGFAGCEDGWFQVMLESRYFRFFWIPIFSLGRRVTVICLSNGAELKRSHYPRKVFEAIDRLKEVHKIPLWHFSGSFLILSLILLTNIFSDKSSDIVQSLRYPGVGDVYTIIEDSADENAKVCHFLKVSELIDSGVILLRSWSNYTMDDYISGDLERKAQANQFYNPSSQFYKTKSDLVTMHQNGLLIDVKRFTKSKYSSKELPVSEEYLKEVLDSVQGMTPNEIKEYLDTFQKINPKENKPNP